MQTMNFFDLASVKERLRKVLKNSVLNRRIRAIFYITVLIVSFTLISFSYNLNRRLTTSCFFDDKVSKAIVLHTLEKPALLSPRTKRELQGTEKFLPFVMRHKTPQALLEDNYPKTVFYVWCGRRSFEFRHYLNVLSVIKFLQPNDIMFYYETYPIMDKSLYNTWFAELLDTYPFLQPIPISQQSGACNSDDDPTKSYIYHILTVAGGVYLDSDVIMTTSIERFKQFDLVLSLSGCLSDKIHFMFVKSGHPCSTKMIWSSSLDENISELSIEIINCPLVSMKGNSNVFDSPCRLLNEQIFPKSIWQLDNSFGRIARSIMYGHSDIRLHIPNMDSQPTPKIGHMIWLGGGDMSFLFYLGVLSLLHVAHMNTVYIHGDVPPSGYYWDLLTIREATRVVYLHRVRPHTIYGQSISSLSHISDIWRADILFKHGGVYLDTDAVFVRPIDEELFNYDAVASLDWPEWNKPFPDTINLGVTMGKRGALYWKLFQESMKWYRDYDFGWNGIRRPYQVYERHPDLLKIDPHFQVICYRLKCHPTWWPDYHKDEVHHLIPGRTFDWRNETYAIHWTNPAPYELKTYRRLLQTDSMFADIGKLILKQSGMLEYFQKIIVA